MSKCWLKIADKSVLDKTVINTVYKVNLCTVPLYVSSAGVGAERRCILSLSNENSFHKCTLLSLPTLPPAQTSITVNVGYTTLACTSHRTRGGDDANPGGRSAQLKLSRIIV